jgi:hypothetical protein
MSVLKMKVQTNAVDLMTTGLNALTFGTQLTGAEINNVQGTGDWDGYPYALLELVLAANTAALAPGSVVSVWFIRPLDGTNYEDAIPHPLRRADAYFFPASTASAQRLVAESPIDRTSRIRLPVGKFKPHFYFPNGGGLGAAGLAASGNTLKSRAWTDEQV